MLDVGDTSAASNDLLSAPPLLSSSALLSSPLETISGLLVLFGGGVVSVPRVTAHLSSTLLLQAPPDPLFHCVPECSPFWVNCATLMATVDLWFCLPAPIPPAGCL